MFCLISQTAHEFQIMWHVATMLPYSPDNPQQLHKKRHLGNDVCMLIFRDHNSTDVSLCVILYVYVVISMHMDCLSARPSSSSSFLFFFLFCHAELCTHVCSPLASDNPLARNDHEWLCSPSTRPSSPPNSITCSWWSHRIESTKVDALSTTASR